MLQVNAKPCDRTEHTVLEAHGSCGSDSFIVLYHRRGKVAWRSWTWQDSSPQRVGPVEAVASIERPSLPKDPSLGADTQLTAGYIPPAEKRRIRRKEGKETRRQSSSQEEASPGILI